MFISDISCSCVCAVGAPDSAGIRRGWNSSGRLGPRSTQLKCWPHRQRGGKQNRVLAIIGSAKGFKLNDWFLLLPSTLNICTFWFNCKWRLIHNSHTRAVFPALAHSHPARLHLTKTVLKMSVSLGVPAARRRQSNGATAGAEQRGRWGRSGQSTGRKPVPARWKPVPARSPGQATRTQTGQLLGEGPSQEWWSSVGEHSEATISWAYSVIGVGSQDIQVGREGRECTRRADGKCPAWYGRSGDQARTN